MKKVYLVGGTIVMLGMLDMPGWSLPATAAPPEIVSAQQAAQVVEVTNVRTRGGTVSGLLVNESPLVARDIDLVIRQSWIWDNERHPGAVSPGRAEFYTVHTEIPPNGTAAFTYDTGPLPQRTDGHFETYVQVVGFTEVGTGTTSRGAGGGTVARRPRVEWSNRRSLSLIRVAEDAPHASATRRRDRRPRSQFGRATVLDTRYVA